MIVNGQEEIWVELNNNSREGKTIIAISNCGRLKRKNEIIENIPLRMQVRHNGERVYCHRLILEKFKPKTEEDKELGRDFVDHITHHPVGINPNDIRNLRWCTIAENNNFEEARHNYSIAKQNMSEETRKKMSLARRGKPRSDECKKKLSIAMRGKSKGKPSPNKGRHWKTIDDHRVWY